MPQIFLSQPMQRTRITINNRLGVHARVAYGLSRLGESFNSRVSIIIENGDGKRFGNGKDIMSILALGILPDSEIVIETEGEDEDKAMKCLLEYMELVNVDKN